MLKNNSAKQLTKKTEQKDLYIIPIIKDYEIKQRIGEGSYAVVYKGKHIPSNTPIAIKVYNKSELTITRQNSIKYEINLLLNIEHPHIVKFIDCFSNSKNIFIVMELIEGVNLYKLFKTRFKSLGLDKNFEKRKDFASKIFKQLISALYYLHKRNINHKDVKLDNIVFDEKNFSIKLVDFGFSKIINTDFLEVISCGTPSYLAPEGILKLNCNTLGVDTWASGVVYYCLLFLRFPFYGETDKILYMSILKDEPKIFFDLKRYEEFFIRATFEKDWRKRIKISELYKYVTKFIN